jgi:hypothetical protein
MTTTQQPPARPAVSDPAHVLTRLTGSAGPAAAPLMAPAAPGVAAALISPAATILPP